MAVVTELVTKFSFSGSTAPLGKFNEQLGGSINLLGKMVGGLIAVSGVINTLVIATLAGADSIGQLAINTGVSVTALQELGYVASVTGSNTQALEGTISNLSQTIGQAAQKGNEDFQRLGISVRDASGEVKTADTILGEVGQRFRELGLSMQEQQSFAQALGIDASLVQMLGKTSAQMLELRKRARDFGLVTEDQQASIISFNDSLTTLRFGMGAIKNQIAIGLSPSIKELSENFIDFIKVNKDLIIDGFVAVGNGITILLETLNRLKFVIAAGIGLFIAFKIATIGLGVVLGAVFSPVVLITAAIVALLVIIDDLMVAMDGGKSIIRDFFLEFFGFDITPMMQQYVADFKAGIEGIKLLFADMFGFVTKGFDGISGAVGTVTSFLGITPGDQAGTTNNSVSQAVNIEIITNDPQAAGQAVSDSLQGQLENANVQVGRGGR